MFSYYTAKMNTLGLRLLQWAQEYAVIFDETRQTIFFSFQLIGLLKQLITSKKKMEKQMEELIIWCENNEK